MYQALLTLKYLTTKLMPLLSVVAVMLCTGLVLIVWSIMGGFLNNLLDTGRTVVGDVLIEWPTVGFAHYDELVDRLSDRPEVGGATPVIETFGLVTLPDDRVSFVKVAGIDPETYPSVIDYEDTLWWKPIDQPLPRDHAGHDPRLDPNYADTFNDLLAHGKALAEPRITPDGSVVIDPALVLGIQVAGFSIRTNEGYYDLGTVSKRNAAGVLQPIEGSSFLPFQRVTLNVLPVDRSGRGLEFVSRVYPVANELHTGTYEIDQSSVLMPLNELQRLLKMDAWTRVEESADDLNTIIIDPDTGQERFAESTPVEVEPARVTTILVRAADDAMKPIELKEIVTQVYAEFETDHAGQVPPAPVIDPTTKRPQRGSITIQTWEDRMGMFIAAVRKETIMVLGIIVLTSFVVSFLILSIFWAMVSEKTKDIGILRAIGASRRGVASLWLSYGLAIGVVGTTLGLIMATLIVWNINPIHDWLGRTFGLSIWDPQIYYFPEIPNQIQPTKLIIVAIGGLLFSVLGALIPAIRAARMDPVKALRFE